MKSINRITIIVGISTLVLGFLLGLLIFGGDHSGEAATDHQHEVSSVQEWTCSMHPSVRQKEPGKCPICGMDLVPVETDHTAENPMEIKMSRAAIQLANIQTSTVKKGSQTNDIRLTGKVQPNEQNVYTQTAHIEGRIEQLLINFTGESVRKGQEIAYVYSPTLVLAQKELFEAYKIRENQPELYGAAREKLKNWKLTDQQIDQIIKDGKPIEQFPILSDISGVVLSKNVNLGDYVKQGSPLFKMANLASLWILLDVHESEMNSVRVGDRIEYEVQSFPGELFTGKVSFIDPVINPNTRVARARIKANNPNMKLKPEMFVTARILSGFHQNSNDIVIPKSAIMWTGKRSVVYVKKETDVGVSFEMREVTLGQSLGDGYIIEDGLNEGEEIATYGTFSIDAAAQLAGKPSMMNPSSGMQMEAHQHKGTMEERIVQPVVETKQIDLGSDVKNVLQSLVQSYLKLKDALVNDDFSLAKKEGGELLKVMKGINMNMFEGEAHHTWMQHGMGARENLDQIVKSASIGDARDLFKPFSEHMIQLVKIFKPFDKKLYIQHCPMADDFKGADWLSSEENIMNPYFGESMLTCGEVTDEISNQ